MAWAIQPPAVEGILWLNALAAAAVTPAAVAALAPDTILLEEGCLPESAFRELTHCPMLVICRRGQESLGLVALQNGALGLLISEELTPEAVAQAIRAARRGEAVLTPRITGQILDALVHPASEAKPNAYPPAGH